MLVHPSGVAALLVSLTLAGPVPAACQLGTFDLPVTMRGREALVSIGINGREALFLADSGAFLSSVSQESAARLKLSVGAPREPIVMHGVGGDTLASVTTVRTFSLGGAQLHDVQLVVAGSNPPGAAGQLGDNVLGLFDTEYDLAHGIIRLVRPRDCGRSDLAYWATSQPYSKMDIDWSEASVHTPHGAAYLDGTAIRVVFDTGASTSILALRAAQRAGVRPGSPGVVPAGESRGAGPRGVASWIAPFDSFKIGDEEVLHTHLRIGDVGALDADMLLGADFFLSHHVYISASQHRVYFTYNGGPVFDLSVAPATSPPTR